MKFSMKLVVSSVLLFSLSVLAADPKGVLRIPVAGDSGSSLTQINLLLKARGLQVLPAFIELSSDMSAFDIEKLKNSVDARISQVIEHEILETSGAYGQVVDGRKACFTGSNKALVGIYEKMISNFLSEQLFVLAVSTKEPNHFGLKFDESDSGSAGSWINIYRCKD